MTDGLSWDRMETVLAGPGTEIRRVDADGLAVCLIRLAAGVRTDELFRGLPGDRCQCVHWGHVISGTIRAHGADWTATCEAGESFHWPAGHNLEAVTDVYYLELSRADEYDRLMEHVRSKLPS